MELALAAYGWDAFSGGEGWISAQTDEVEEHKSTKSYVMKTSATAARLAKLSMRLLDTKVPL